MGLVERVQARVVGRPRKQFTMPPVWSIDGAKVSLQNAGITPNWEMVGSEYVDYVQSMYKTNGIIFACIAARARVFCQARFLWQAYRNGRPGEFSWNNTLELLDTPWLNGTLGEWLHLMELDATLAGNHYATRVDASGRVGARANGSDSWIARLRPDWVKIILGSPVPGLANPYHPSVRVVGYWYLPPGGGPDQGDMLLLPQDVMHYSPLPDPMARFLGMSWLTPVIRELFADRAMTEHKISFLQNSATPNLAIAMDAQTDPDDFEYFVAKFKEEFAGAGNAYKTLFVGGGADVTPLSVDFKALEFTSSQGRGETRIASAAGVHPAIVGLSEGLQGSSLNQGNFMAARRLFVDGTMRDLWNKAAPSMQTLFKPPSKGKRLAPDVRDIPFLREDDSAEVEMLNKAMSGIRQAVEAGFEPDAVTEVFVNRDMARLIGHHTGRLSVQLQDPNKTNDQDANEQVTEPADNQDNNQTAPQNGNGNGNGGKVRSTKPFMPA